MSGNMNSHLIQNRKTYACDDTNCGPAEQIAAPLERDLFAQQTGQLLLTLGHMLVNVPPFNSHIRPATGKRLISIGRKLAQK